MFQQNTIKQSLADCYLPTADTALGTSGKLHILEYEHYKELNVKKTVFSQSGQMVCGTTQPIQPIPYAADKSTDYILFPFIFGLALFVLCVFRYRHYLVSFFESLIYKFIGDRIVDDINVPIRKVSIILDALLVLFIGFFGLNTIVQFELFPLPLNHKTEILYFAIILAGFLVYKIYLFLIMRVVHAIVYNKKFTFRLQFEAQLTYRLMGFVLLPFTFAIRYNHTEIGIYLYYIVLCAFMAMIVYRFFRLLTLFMQNGISILYFFLYLCAVEIIPILLVVRLVWFYGI